MKTKRKPKFRVLSPDGLPIAPAKFTNRASAKSYLALWCAKFERQGFYSAVDGRIPLADLPKRCSIVKV